LEVVSVRINETLKAHQPIPLISHIEKELDWLEAKVK